MPGEPRPMTVDQAKAQAARLNDSLAKRGVTAMRWIVTKNGDLRLVGRG